MTAGIIALIVLVILLVAVGAFLAKIYNTLVRLRNRFENAFAQIEVQLKRRHDLIPNLVETAKGYLSHEKETLENVTKARNQAQSALEQAQQQPGEANAMKNLAGAEGTLANALGRLNMVMEDYPDLKANENMMQLSEEMTSTENKIAFARQAYNDAVMRYNTYKQSFPTVAVAGMFGHANDAEPLEFDSEQIREAPEVSF